MEAKGRAQLGGFWGAGWKSGPEKRGKSTRVFCRAPGGGTKTRTPAGGETEGEKGEAIQIAFFLGKCAPLGARGEGVGGQRLEGGWPPLKKNLAAFFRGQKGTWGGDEPFTGREQKVFCEKRNLVILQYRGRGTGGVKRENRGPGQTNTMAICSPLLRGSRPRPRGKGNKINSHFQVKNDSAKGPSFVELRQKGGGRGGFGHKEKLGGGGGRRNSKLQK